MSTPSPKSPEQSEKSKKYDRQLRLWGDHGQNNLETSHVCLINATALGTEILKSLILPGIGAFSIVDGKKVTEEDIGSNFFLEPDDIGSSRAQTTTRYLLEMNPDVQGDYIDESPDHVLAHDPDFFSSFTIVIATSIPEKILFPLASKLWELDVPLIVCRSIGFLGYIRVQVKEHSVIESHPDNQISDLRLDKPFPALLQHMDSINIDEMSLKDHSHIPQLVILYKHLQQWKKEHNDSIPNNFKEKQLFREQIRQSIRVDEQGIPIAEENFEEAIRAINSSLQTTSIPANVQEILNDDNCVNLTQKSKPFWIMAKAMKDFVDNEGNGCLPVRGSLPDMTADTTSYIALQQIYHKQASADSDIVHRRVQQLLHELGQSADLITERDVRLFCRHASELYLVRGSCIADEYNSNAQVGSYIADSLENPDSMMVYYVMLRGLDRFYSEYNAYPGEFDDQVEPDIVKLKSSVSKLLNEWACAPLAKDDYVHELCRYGGTELHSVSAYVGGCVAHEAIKFITRQYRPIKNTFIYDGITSNTATFVF